MAAFAVIVAARHLLEILTGQNPVYFPLQFFVHYPLAYIAPLLALVLLSAAFTWGGHAASWESREPPSAPNRLATDTLLGRSALALSTGGERYPRMLFQELAPPDGQRLQGQAVTLGAWLRLAEGAAAPVVLG